MLDALTVARDAMREVVKEFSLAASVDLSEFEEVLRMNEFLSRESQEILDRMLVDAYASNDVLADARNLATFFQATERLMTTMLGTRPQGQAESRRGGR